MNTLFTLIIILWILIEILCLSILLSSFLHPSFLLFIRSDFYAIMQDNNIESKLSVLYSRFDFIKWDSSNNLMRYSLFYSIMVYTFLYLMKDYFSLLCNNVTTSRLCLCRINELISKIESKVAIESEYLSKEMITYLDKSIQEFESSKMFLNKEMSLSSLSARLGVNSRYLSYYINKNKEKDFANYINELRIGYIVKSIEKNSNYRKYKISHLADKSGFSSHSRFTINFKKVTGVLPSEYISEIKERHS
ncbi:Helix-turn-helix domain-containing protein [Myroides marinus]|uniref:Helix-turn-helix domain-containing protein n=1 Tax=Myroides marinus TaxID=703342 RepID=A0A1H6Y0Q2_9FLAO|nr:helix-turn-helix domain-containing protein [Myroides marinus]SEJ34026.1 Helix-turn-helix domain-containing protein [Myroides marinus]